MARRKVTMTTFNNNFGVRSGVKLLSKYFDFKMNKKEISNRNYHEGVKSILNDNTPNTVFTCGILTCAEGITPRLLLFS